MSSLSAPSLLHFSIGVSRVGIRHGSHLRRYKEPQPDKAGFVPGHGEQIWIYNHTLTNQIVYSLNGVLDSNKALKQLPFNGKKLKPAKLRKDYWRHMAMIRLPPGAGDVGRSVYQKLREFRRSHELEWGYQEKELYGHTKEDRGKALNNQRANAVADMAAVLGGAGRGSLVWRSTPATGEAAAQHGSGHTVVKTEKAAQTVQEGVKSLWPATIYWTNVWDWTLAKTWPESVTHVMGLDPSEHGVPMPKPKRLTPPPALEEAAVVEEAAPA